MYSSAYTYLGEYFNQPGVANIAEVQFENSLSSGNTGLIYRRKFTDSSQNYHAKIGENKPTNKKSNQPKETFIF